MLSRRVWRLLVPAAALIAWLPMSASAGFADDAGGATLTITAPDEFTAGQQQTVTVAAHTATPVPTSVWLILDVQMPARLTPLSAQGSGMDCFVDALFGVSCTGLTPFTDGSVQITVQTAPGDAITDTIQATLHADNDRLAHTSKDVHIAATPSGLGVQIDTPDRLRPGNPVTITATFSADHVVTDPVSLDLSAISARLSVLTASAPGFDCTVRPRVGVGTSFSPSSAGCTGNGLTHPVTLTVTVTVEPGSTEPGSIEASILVGQSSASDTADVIVVGSDTTTVSGVVWNDLDRDGRRDPDEPGVGGVTVTGNTFSSALTDEDGTYTLTDMDRGDSSVLFVAPGKFDFTTPNVGDDQHDSDVTSVHRECPDCVMGSLSFTLTDPLSHVDAGLFDPKVPPPSTAPTPTATPTPTHGATPGPTTPAPTTPAPQAGLVPTALASTGVPVSGLVAIGVLLLAAGVALLNLQHRRFQRRDHASDQT